MKELDLIREELLFECKDYVKNCVEYLLNYTDIKDNESPYLSITNIEQHIYDMWQKINNLKEDLLKIERTDSLIAICKNKKKRRERDFIKKKLNETKNELEGDEWVDSLIEHIKDMEMNSPIENYFGSKKNFDRAITKLNEINKQDKENAEKLSEKLYGDMASE